MADFADRASVAAEQHLRSSLAAVGQNGSSAGEVFFCVECDEKIPEGRRKAMPGVALCVYCQELKEAQD
jgi:phage/conjugal plasmid C-4 type zinc finger TraR family protein